MALSSPTGLAECFRRAAGPDGRELPLRADQYAGAAPSALHPRNDGPRDHLAHPVGLAGRPGPARGRGGPGPRAGPTTGGRPATPLLPACSFAPRPASTVTSRSPRTSSPSSSTGRRPAYGPTRGTATRRCRCARRWAIRHCPSDVDSGSVRPAPGATGGRPWRRASPPSPRSPGRARPENWEEAQSQVEDTVVVLAGLAVQRHVPGSPVAELHGAQRPHPEGPQLRADRRHHGRRDHLAARDARRRRATGTTAIRGSATRPSCCARSTASDSTGRRWSTSPSSWRRWRATPASWSCRSCTASTAARISPSTRSTICPDGATRGRCGSATAPGTSTRTTCGA